MNIADAIATRRSVRGFLPQDVPQEDLQAIFQLAQHAPSNCNTQPWVVHVVSGAALRQLGQRLCQAALDPAQHAPDFPYDGRYEGVYRERQQDSAAQLFNALGIARERAGGLCACQQRNAAGDADHGDGVQQRQPQAKQATHGNQAATLAVNR